MIKINQLISFLFAKLFQALHRFGPQLQKTVLKTAITKPVSNISLYKDLVSVQKPVKK